MNKNNEGSLELTDTQKDFIGSTFLTPKSTILTVTGITPSSVGSKIRNCRFIVECSSCSKDRELFPDEFTSTKSNLTTGKIPCGCARNPNWSEHQYKVRVQRLCTEKGYIFHGWFGNYNKRSTYVDLENPKTGNRWQSGTIKSFLRGHGDPVEAVHKRTVNDDQHIHDFMKTGSFIDGTIFCRSDKVYSTGAKIYWKYTCPICSNDEYVKAGVCTGIFEGDVSSMKKGIRSCRCSKGYNWTQKQREYQIKKICTEEDLTFINWCDEKYKGVFSRFRWLCKEGHKRTTSIYRFLAKRRCKTCADEKLRLDGIVFGYYKKRIHEKDFLYILNFNNEYIKVGRSFNVEKRIVELKGQSLCENIIVLGLLTSTHQNVYDTEQWLHKELTTRGFYHHESAWTVETFTMDSEETIYRLLKDTKLSELDLKKGS